MLHAMPTLSRRSLIKGSVATFAIAMTQRPLSVFGFDPPTTGEELVKFVPDQIIPKDRTMLQWDELTSWITPNEQIFNVAHYGYPEVDVANWNLTISGWIKKPLVLTLDDLKKRRRKTVTATLECSGNGSNPGFMGAIANAKWTGTSLGSLLKDAGLHKRAREVVFFGADTKEEELRSQKFDMHFSRALALGDAMADDVILCWEVNGEPLSAKNGAPVRLIVPGWFGIAWTKWLTRIELLDRRFMSKYMGREYVTIRGEKTGDNDGEMLWRETSVGPIATKSIVARVTKLPDGDLKITGAAWTDGTPLKNVELQIDGGEWIKVELDRKNRSKYSWTFWSYVWKNPPAGEHKLVSRATDTDGGVQPALTDPEIKNKRTYWEANQQFPRRIRV
jgi:DMSO/TMAO reductase YedYZ molybdopterin-dependent catalytic subunit